MVMTAEKDNKVYSIDEGQMAAYQVAGYDIYGDDGNVIAYGAGKTVAYEDYMALKKENEELRAKIAELEIQEKEPAVEPAVEPAGKAATRKKAVE